MKLCMIPELFGHCKGNIILDSYHSNQIVSYTKNKKINPGKFIHINQNFLLSNHLFEIYSFKQNSI